MGDMSMYRRCDAFVKEFQEDILRVYGLPEAPNIKGQWIGENDSFQVRHWIELQFEKFAIEAIVQGPIFYDAMSSDEDNVSYMEEAMNVDGGLERAEIEARMRRAGLIR